MQAPSEVDPRTARRAASWRAHLIRTGRILPLEARPTLRMDAKGRAAAERHMKAGDYGHSILGGPDFFTLPFWLTAALEKRERRTAQFNAFLKRTWPPFPQGEITRALTELIAR